MRRQRMRYGFCSRSRCSHLFLLGRSLVRSGRALMGWKSQAILRESVNRSYALCFVGRDGRVLIQDVAQLIYALQQAMLGKRIDWKLNRRTVRQGKGLG